MSLLLIGVGHVFRLEQALTDIIVHERPEVVALELDPARFQALRQRAAGAPPPDLSKAPRAYRLLARFQQDVAADMGTEVGGEMIASARAAEAVGARIVLVDRGAEDTVNRLWAELTWREKMKLFGAVIASKLPFRKGRTVEAEIERYQNDPAAYLAEVESGYPTVTRVLIHERNEHMAKRLLELETEGRRTVAILGDGHLPGILKLVAVAKPRVIRLKELREGTAGPLAWKTEQGGGKVTFSFDQTSLEGSGGSP